MTDISVIVCSFNRSERLVHALDSIGRAAAHIAPATAELLIVDDASTDDTAKVAAQWATSAGFPVHILPGAGRGLSAARNVGLRHASGRILAFTDDDCVLSPDYLQVLLSLYSQDSVDALRGGRVELGDSDDLPYTIKRDTQPATYKGRYPNGFLHGCNLTMSRGAHEKIGFFDERFGAGAIFPSAEDSDYIHRAFRAGIAAQYCPELLVYHFHGRRDMASIRKLFTQYTVGDGALFAKHILDWRMASCLLGNIYRTVREWFGGRHFDPTFGFTYRAAVIGNLRGVGKYLLHGKRITPARKTLA